MPSQKIAWWNSAGFQKALRIGGSIVTLVALAFVAWRIWILAGSNSADLLKGGVLAAVLLGGLLYGFDGLLLVWAWQRLLLLFGETLQFDTSVVIYGRSYIAKYIPGNVFHLPSRHVMGNRAGLGHPALIAAAVCEILCLLGSAAVIAATGYAGRFIEGRFSIWPFVIAVLLVAVLVAVWPALFRRFIKSRLQLPERPMWDNMLRFLAILAIYTVFLLAAGAIFSGLVGASTGAWKDLPVGSFLSIYAVSWLAGFITPGAPAGLGCVRRC